MNATKLSDRMLVHVHTNKRSADYTIEAWAREVETLERRLTDYRKGEQAIAAALLGRQDWEGSYVPSTLAPKIAEMRDRLVKAEKQLSMERAMTLAAFKHIAEGVDPELIGHPNGSEFGHALREMLEIKTKEAWDAGYSCGD